MAWDDRFKRASARRRQARLGEEVPRRLDDAVIEEARRTSPETWLRSRYGAALTLNPRGDTISIEDVLRVDRQPDGRWVACDWAGDGIGDTIALVMWAADVEFRAAVEQLVGGATVAPAPVALPSVVVCPRLPALAGEAEGQAYLEGRGISAETIEAALQSGALRWCSGGVLFLGRDHSSANRTVRSATIRYFQPTEGPDGKLVTKRDLSHSDKGLFPVLLHGVPETILVVEGGVSGLAAADMSRRRGRAAPTVVITGGANVRAWVSGNAPLRAALVAADRVLIVGEREVDVDGQPDQVKQARTDAARAKLAEVIAEARGGRAPEVVYPPEGVKDAAGWNIALAAEIAARAVGVVP